MIGAILPAILGIGIPGLNASGVQATPVTAAGTPSGTLAGVYGDTGIFYSTSPDTVWQSFTTSGGYDGSAGTNDNSLTNNRGLTTIPTTRRDAEQLIAYGLSSPAAPVIDPNGRGNTPWDARRHRAIYLFVATTSNPQAVTNRAGTDNTAEFGFWAVTPGSIGGNFLENAS